MNKNEPENSSDEIRDIILCYDLTELEEIDKKLGEIIEKKKKAFLGE